MLNAARAQGIPMIVIAMTTAATSQPNAIHAPPRTIQMILSSSETGDMAENSILPCARLKSKTALQPEPDCPGLADR